MAETTEQYRARINQLKTSIENEPLIKKMRNDIAEGISKTGNRQADIEVQFQSVIDGTTGKDVISAPEIIAARNGETNLKTRLDKNEQEVAAQLAQKAEQAALNVEKERIDSFTALAAGSTTGDAELIDGRVGVVGISYPNIGGAMRAVATGINLARESITPEKTTFFASPTNLFNRETALVNKTINYGNGAISDATGWNVAINNPVKPNTTYTRSGDTNLIFQRADKTRISGLANGSGKASFTTPSDCYFVSYNVWATDVSTSTFMLVEGTTLPETFVKHQYSFNPDFPLFIPKASEIANDISAWGDSLTDGIGGNGTNYPSLLSNLTGRTVNNMGIGGESTIDIMARQGAYPAVLNPFVIPAGTDSVEITYKNDGFLNDYVTGGTPRLGQLGTKGVNPVEVDGIKGNISYANGKYYFTRLVSGSQKSVNRPIAVITHAMKKYKDDTQVIFMGTNGGFVKTGEGEEFAIKSLISQIDLMIDYNNSKKNIIIGMHYYYDFIKSNGVTRENLEYALLNKYGRKYINLRKYLVEFGLEDAGLTATDNDITAIAKGEVPPSLLNSDGIHGNSYFYNILANLVNKRGKELGYWN